MITVQWAPPGELQRAILVTGRHRLEAFRRLGWAKAPAAIFNGNDDEARLWQLAENLARNDLTALERAEQLNEFLARKGVQDGQVSGGRGHTGGISAAARELGTSRQELYRAQEIAALAPETKTAALHLGLADNSSALRRASGKPGAEAQIAELRKITVVQGRPRTLAVGMPKVEFETRTWPLPLPPVVV